MNRLKLTDMIEGEKVADLEKTINTAKSFKKKADTCGKYGTYFEETAQDISCFCQDVLELLKEQQWIPASEKLPEEYEPVLVWEKRAEYEIMHMEKTLQGDMWLNDHDFYISTENTWWMPLPKPPKAGEQE